MKALFLAERKIIPSGIRTLGRNTDGWLAGENCHLAFVCQTAEHILKKLQPIVDQCDLIVISLGADGEAVLDRIVLSGFRWPAEKILFVLSDAFPRSSWIAIEARVPGADCMAAEENAGDGMADYILNFLLRGEDPRSHVQATLDRLLQRLDPFRRKYPR